MSDFKKIILPILLVIFFIIGVGLLYRKLEGLTLPPGKNTVKIKDVSINVEIAKTNEEKQKGLSGRESLAKDSGMLFIFDPSSTPNFWMKDMKFAIDIIWIKEGKIIKIDGGIQPPSAGTPDNKLKIYTPGASIDKVLEVNAGFADTNNFKTGDSVLTQ